MTWYNPLTWFGKGEKRFNGDESTPLYCANPQCKSPIFEEPLAYDKDNREVYHNGQCATFANALRALKSDCVVFSNLDYITLDKAIDLLKKGKLKQTATLEEKL